MTGPDSPAAHRATSAKPGIPGDPGGPVFAEPWEAQAFAMALALNERGVFGWAEWTAILADEIKRAQAAGDPDEGDTYYHHVLAALERIVTEKGLTTEATLKLYHDGWAAAARRTAHGRPITLKPEDLAARGSPRG